jgi:hypothetical protein
VPWLTGRNGRLLIWTLAVAGVWFAQALTLYFPHRTAALAWTARGLCVLGLLVIAALLATTPVNAIRLRRPTSEILILAVAMLITCRESFRLVILRLAATVVLLVLLRFQKNSAWWAVLIAWLPA